MAITYDAPSTSWQTESEITNEPRITYPIPQNLSAVFYEKDYVINQCYFTQTALDTVMASTQLDGSITSATTTITVDSTADFPCFGSIIIGAETIPYTGRTPTTFTGATVTASHSDGAAVTSNAFLVEVSAAETLGGTMIKYNKRFATVPDDWVDYSESVFQFPGYYNDVYESNYRCPQSLNATIKTTATYKKTTDPYADLDVANQMFRVVDADDCVLDYVDASSSPTYTVYTGYVSASTLIYAAQSTLERFAGNIWVRFEHQTKAQ